MSGNPEEEFDLRAADLSGGEEGGFDLRNVDLGDGAAEPVAAGDGTPANGDTSWQDDEYLSLAADVFGDDLLNFGKGAVDGLTLNNAAELGGLGQKIGHALGSLHDDSGLERNTQSTGDDDLDAMYDAANKTGMGALGHTLGSINTSIAGSVVPGIGGQAAMGALQGGLSAGGVSDYNPYAMIAGGTTGGALGALGGAARAGAKKVGDFLGRGTSTVTGYKGGEPILETLSNADRLTKAAGTSLDDAVLGMAEGKVNPARVAALLAGTKGAQKFAKHGDLYPQLALLGRAGLDAGAGVASAQDAPLNVEIGEAEMLDDLLNVQIGEAEMLPEWKADIGEAQMLPEWKAEIGEAEMRPTNDEYADNYKRLLEEEGTTRVEAPPHLQPPKGMPSNNAWDAIAPRDEPYEPHGGIEIGEAEIKAYAGLPALTYSVHSVLSSGDDGLPPAARDQLTRAALSGDQDKVKATNFKLSQRYPEYARRLQETLDDLNASQE